MGIQLLSNGINANDLMSKTQIESLVGGGVEAVAINSGLRIDQAINGTAGTSFPVGTASSLVLYPFPLENKRMRASSFEVSVGTASAAGRFRVALYDSNTDGSPKDLIWFGNEQTMANVGSIPVRSLSFKTAPATYETRNLNTMVFEGGTTHYWIGFLTVAAGGSVRGIAVAGLTQFGLTAANATTYVTHQFKTGITSFPDLNPISTGGFTTATGPVPSIRFLTATV